MKYYYYLIIYSFSHCAYEMGTYLVSEVMESMARLSKHSG